MSLGCKCKVVAILGGGHRMCLRLALYQIPLTSAPLCVARTLGYASVYATHPLYLAADSPRLSSSYLSFLVFFVFCCSILFFIFFIFFSFFFFIFCMIFSLELCRCSSDLFLSSIPRTYRIVNRVYYRV